MPKNKQTENEPVADENAQGFTTNPEVEKRLNAYIGANPNDLQYYTKIVKEAPDRAIRVLMLKDLYRHDSEMKMVDRQLPQAQAFYEKQTPEKRAQIDAVLEKVNPYYKKKAFVGEILREMGRQNRVALSSPKAGMSVG